MVFKDITPLLADHDGFAAVVGGPGRRRAATAPERSSSTRSSAWRRAASSSARPVALALGAGFVPVRKAGKLPRATHAVSYALEYGEATLEVHRDAIAPGERVLLVDDVLATGGTARRDPRAGRGVRRRRRRRRRADGAAASCPAAPPIGDLPLHRRCMTV